MGRAARQAVTTNPQKTADAIVVTALKLVGGDEGQGETDLCNLRVGELLSACRDAQLSKGNR